MRIDLYMKNKSLLRIILLIVACGCILLGLIRGEAQVVLGKAITVCMECIGLG